MAEAVSAMINSSQLRRVTNLLKGERFTISNCIKALDEIEGIEDNQYYAALYLFKNPRFRELFISLKSNYVRLTRLQRKVWKLCSRHLLTCSLHCKSVD
ncbi:hypothetical protein CDL12_20822 [Handroanthus impetiginosus]|uniref:Uncharacterized protein n=1 Tax=Handroanthus impetiginosus TaxID=429701 RepID=A0A2G9GN28_9LAMI|nr:hypothetical protein CDL12_20822 [Handroanthus impetiginosus]